MAIACQDGQFLANERPHNTFSGSVLRLAKQDEQDPDAVWESWFLSLLPDREQAVTMFEQIYRRSTTRWWMVDVFDFVDLPKREPAMVYQRRIKTAAPSTSFVPEYFQAPYTLDPDFDPYARNPRGFDPAVRGSVEARARELDLYRKVARTTIDDPWYDVNLAYEHYTARSLLGIDGEYLEAVWLFSAGNDADPAEILRTAVDAEAERSKATVLAIIGPYPANESAMISTGMRVTRAYRRFASGVDEFDSKIVRLSDWK